jgi:hypothetical protein
MTPRIIRVFPRKTRATPTDALAYFGPIGSPRRFTAGRRNHKRPFVQREDHGAYRGGGQRRLVKCRMRSCWYVPALGTNQLISA